MTSTSFSHTLTLSPTILMRNVFHSPIGLSAILVGFDGFFWLLYSPPEPTPIGGLDGRIPDLHLRAAAQINAAIAIRQNLPIDEQFEIAVVLGRAQAASLAVEFEGAVDDLPVGPHVLVGLLLRGGQIGGGRGGPLGGIFEGALGQPFPAGQVLAIEHRHEAGRRLVVSRRAGNWRQEWRVRSEPLRQNEHCASESCDESTNES